jgi:very-short-patch-repair endonuclease
MLPYNNRLRKFASDLRKNMTDAETRLWWRLRKKQLSNCQFYRQRIICNYIVDFYCPAFKLVVEIDGGQHFEDEGIRKDKLRDSYLADLGLTVLRFSARDVMQNLEGVLESIYERLK